MPTASSFIRFTCLVKRQSLYVAVVLLIGSLLLHFVTSDHCCNCPSHCTFCTYAFVCSLTTMECDEYPAVCCCYACHSLHGLHHSLHLQKGLYFCIRIVFNVCTRRKSFFRRFGEDLFFGDDAHGEGHVFALSAVIVLFSWCLWILSWFLV